MNDESHIDTMVEILDSEFRQMLERIRKQNTHLSNQEHVYSGLKFFLNHLCTIVTVIEMPKKQFLDLMESSYDSSQFFFKKYLKDKNV